MTDKPLSIRKVNSNDLADINQLISAAVNTWNLPERVIRLSLPGYHYTVDDLDHLQIFIATHQQQITGVIALEDISQHDSVLLHGIYVSPQCYHQGIGRSLFQYAVKQACEQGYRQLQVRAQADASGFFQTMGMQKMAVENQQKDYLNRYHLVL